MVGVVDMGQATSVAIDCLFVLQGQEKGVALKLQGVGLRALFDSTSLDHHLGVWLRARGTLHHLSLRLGSWLLDGCGLFSWDEICRSFFLFLCFLCLLLSELVPRFVVIEHRCDIPLQFIDFF